MEEKKDWDYTKYVGVGLAFIATGAFFYKKYLWMPKFDYIPIHHRFHVIRSKIFIQ
jgi:hypothetical protein